MGKNLMEAQVFPFSLVTFFKQKKGILEALFTDQSVNRWITQTIEGEEWWSETIRYEHANSGENFDFDKLKEKNFDKVEEISCSVVRGKHHKRDSLRISIQALEHSQIRILH